MAGIKVGEGYIEISPRVKGITRDLQREIQRKLNDLEEGKFNVKPRISGITKVWQTEIQRELNNTINGLTVDVKVKLDKNGLSAAFNSVEVEATETGRDAGDGMADGFTEGVNEIRNQMRRVETAIKAGLVAADSSAVRNSLKDVSFAFKDLAFDVDESSRRQVNALRSGVNEMTRLNGFISRSTKETSSTLKSEFEKVAKSVTNSTGESLDSLSRFDRGLSTVQRAVRESFAESTKKGFTEAATIIKKFADDAGIGLAQSGMKAGQAFGSSLSDAISTTARFGIAQFVVGLPAMFAGAAVAAGPLIAAIGQIVAALVALGSQAFYAAGALAALPQAFSAVMQATSVLGIAFTGVQEALGALQSEQDKAGSASNAMAQAMEVANRRVENAKRALADAVEQSAERITDAEASLARTQELASERITAAQENAAERIGAARDRLAEVQEQVADRIAQAQDRLTSAIERSNERIASAESRLASVRDSAARKVEEAQSRISKAVEDGARRVESAERGVADALRDVTKAQEDLNRAREEAAERLEDLANDVISGQLSERGAQIALEEAQSQLEKVFGDPKSTDLERRKAQLAYDEAVQRLAEIKERNEDLRKEQEKANREGVEGSEEVTNAKDAVIEAIERQRDAERNLADARREATEAVLEAEKDLQEAREEASRDIADAEAELAEARKEAARDIAEAEKAINDARLKGAKDIADAEKALSKEIMDGEKAVAEARLKAARDIADAEKDLADARRDGARQVEDAQRAVKEAMEDAVRASQKQTAAVNETETALKKLSPAAREFVLFIDREILPKFKEIQFAIQDAFFPPIQEALSKSSDLFDLFKVKLTDTATIFGDFAADVINWLNTDETQNSLGRIMDSNNRIFQILAEAAKDAGDAILALVESSGPFLESMARLVGDIVTKIKEMITEAEQNGKLTEFWERVETVIKRLVEIAWDLGEALGGIMNAAYPAGEKLLKIIGDNVKEFADWVTSTEGQNQLRDWFNRGVEVFEELLKLVKDIAKWFLEISTKYNFAELIKTFREKLLPPIQKLVDTLAGDNGEGLNSLMSALGSIVSIMAPAVDILGAAWDSMFPQSFTETITDVSIAFQLLGGAVQVLSGDVVGGTEQIKDAWNKMMERSKSASYDEIPDHVKVMGGHLGVMRKEGAAHIRGFSEDHSHAWGVVGKDVDEGSSNAKDTAVKNFKGLAQGAGEALSGIEKDSPLKWKNISKTVEDGTKDAKNSAVNGFQAMKDGIATKFGDTSKWIRDTGAPGIVNAADGKADSLRIIGNNYGVGFWNGLAGVWNGLIDWWNRNVDGLVEIAKRILGINSPSRRMIEVGKSVGEGMAIGIQSSNALVHKATKAMAESVVTSWGDVNLGVNANLPDVSRNILPVKSASGQNLYNTQPVKAERQYNITMVAAPTTPTERQLLNVISYADSLYN